MQQKLIRLKKLRAAYAKRARTGRRLAAAAAASSSQGRGGRKLQGRRRSRYSKAYKRWVIDF